MVSQFEWKKLAEKPSGPDVLSAWIAKRASLISRAVDSCIRASFASEDTQARKDQSCSIASSLISCEELFVVGTYES